MSFSAKYMYDKWLEEITALSDCDILAIVLKAEYTQK